MTLISATGGDSLDRRPESSELSLTIELMIDDEGSMQLPALLRYSYTQPLVVLLEFPGRQGQAIRRMLSRDLLLTGLEQASGNGGVQVWPPCKHHGRKSLRIRLRGTDASAVLDLPFKAVRSWLRGTLRMVPQGREGAELPWDDDLRSLTSRN